MFPLRSALAIAMVAIAVAVPIILEESDAEGAFLANDSLSDSQKRAYVSLERTVESLGDRCDISYLTADEATDVSNALKMDRPDLFWFNTQYTLYVQAQNGMAKEFRHTGDLSHSDIESMSEELQEVISAITVEGTSVAGKIRSIHDSIAFGMKYDKTTENCGNIYGALVEGKAKCDGYSYAFGYLCALNSISCVTFLGTTDSEEDSRHAWNAVLAEGQWYFVDVTWDDVPCPEAADYDYFLIGSDTATPSGKFSKVRTIEKDYGITVSDRSFPYDAYPDGYGRWAFGISLKEATKYASTSNTYSFNVGEFRVSINSVAMKAIKSALESRTANYWGLSLETHEASNPRGMADPFGLTVTMYIDEEPISPKAVGLDKGISITVPDCPSDSDRIADVYYKGSKISHGPTFSLEGAGDYDVGYVEKTFLEKWGYVVWIAAFFICLIFAIAYSRRATIQIPEDIGIGRSSMRRFDIDSVCQECGLERDPELDFCPKCGRKYQKLI